MYGAPAKITKKKLIEVIILILIIIWVLLFMVNYFRYTRDEPPILAIHTKYRCDDGFIHNYSAFGYTYRKYDSTSIHYTEFVPFWVGAKKCEMTNGLPSPYKEFPVPSNPKYETNYRGLVYLYVYRTKLIGAYKCINSDDKCTMAVSATDDYDIFNKDALLALPKQPDMNVLYERFAFIDDTNTDDTKKDDSQYVRTIYYYDALNKVILDRFADVKHSLIDNYSRGTGDKQNYYIVKSYDNRKWGLAHFKEDGTYDKILDFEYDSINYLEDTGFYILSKDDKWYVYDLDKDEYLMKDHAGIIYDFWENDNMSYYYKIGTPTKLDSGEEFVAFKVNKLGADSIIDVSDVAAVLHTKQFVMYWKYDDNTLHFRDYVEDNRVDPIKLYFRELNTDNNHLHPAFEYKMDDDKDSLSLRVYEGRELKYEYKSYFINSRSWH